MESKFVKGARVRVIALSEKPDVKIGQVGTMLETSHAPWIEFDEPTTWPFPVLNYEVGISEDLMGIAGKEGFCDCVEIHNLEIVRD